MEKKWGNTHKNYTDKQLEKINNSKVNKFIQNLKNKPIIENTFYNNPLYNMNKDIIKLPNIQIFDNISIYYHILFHELIHSTEHRNRLYDVNSIKLFKQNGVYDIKDAKYYAINEIETEIGAIILSRIFNIHSTIKYGIKYVNIWILNTFNYKSIFSKKERTPEFIKKLSINSIKRVEYMINNV